MNEKTKKIINTFWSNTELKNRIDFEEFNKYLRESRDIEVEEFRLYLIGRREGWLTC